MIATVSDTAAPAVVSLWVDDASTGCGERLFVVVKRGHKWVTLLSPSSLDHIEVDVREFDRHAKACAVKPRSVRAILARNVKTAKRHSSRFSAKLVDAAKEVLQ